MVESAAIGVRSSLAFLVLAAITGLFGFFIVYHYASFGRPIQRFAIVIDAGSTQTRSSLYSISLDDSALIGGADNQETTTTTTIPLSAAIQVREVGSCVNGGPLAAIQSESEASHLIDRCLLNFARRIKRLDFLEDEHELKDMDEALDAAGAADDKHLDVEEVDRQMALLNHRINSVTYVHMGATAGLRALNLLNSQKASERIQWIREAINESNDNILRGSVLMNPGFVGIIEGSSEASFGWLSVNFACDQLQLGPPGAPAAAAALDSRWHYSLEGGGGADHSASAHETQDGRAAAIRQQSAASHSIGTLELGGASAQMAFQVRGPQSSEMLVLNKSMQADGLQLFGNNYHLATRSDLCLGMSQAILRANYIILREYFRKFSPFLSQFQGGPAGAAQQAAATSSIGGGGQKSIEIEIENPCLQNGSRHGLSGPNIESFLSGACLVTSTNGGGGDDDEEERRFKEFISSQGKTLLMVGSGDTNRCELLLGKLIDPMECAKWFSICPSGKNSAAPPTRMPFVTISGYNKALQVLNLSRATATAATAAAAAPAAQHSRTTRESIIEQKLGGFAIDYLELKEKSAHFCALNVSEFPLRFPKMNKHFYDVNCLQIIYIRKLLTEFYLFEPQSSWNQIRFLLFPIGGGGTKAAAQSEYSDGQEESRNEKEKKKKKDDKKNDIGWTLGLLLNATSWELEKESQQMDELRSSSAANQVVFHHGATIAFVIRTTIFLMFACLLIAASIIVFGVLLARRKYRSSYICHTSGSSGRQYQAAADPERASPPSSL